MTSAFHLVTHLEENSRLSVEVHGDLDGGAEPEMLRLHGFLQEPGLRSIWLDFGHLRYMNSTGIALVVGLLARAHAAHIDVVAFGIDDHYRQVFQVARLVDFMETFPDRAAALRAARV